MTLTFTQRSQQQVIGLLELGRNNSTPLAINSFSESKQLSIGSIGVEGGDSLYIQSPVQARRFAVPLHWSYMPVRNGVANNVIDLGASTQQFANLYLGTGLYVSGSQVINSSRNLTNIGQANVLS